MEYVLDICDGFLIPGGGDISPALYNGTNSGLSVNIDPAADEIDKKVILFAIKNKKPLLGICRGLQIINAVLGGTLHEHIDNHSDITYDHHVSTEKNNLLHFEKNIIVNSYHHQAIKKLSDELEPVAYSKDGYIEAAAHKKLPVFGVQWHPERITNTTASKIVFGTLFELVSKWKK